MIYTTFWHELFSRPRPGNRIGKVAHRILHHEAGRPLPATATVAQEIARFKAIDAYHLSKGWGGFAYSAMPCASGRIYEGRGYFRSGTHTGHMNYTSLAVMLPGTDQGMTAAQIKAIRQWDQAGVKAGALTPDGKWTGHRDHMPRDCPGDRNYRQLWALNNRTNPTEPEDEMAKLSEEAQEFWEDTYRDLKKREARPTSLGNILDWLRALRDAMGK